MQLSFTIIISKLPRLQQLYGNYRIIFSCNSITMQGYFRTFFNYFEIF